LKELGVFGKVVALDVVEQLTTAGGHLEEAAATVEVLAMGAEVLGQVVDASGQQGDLDLGGAGVFIVGFIEGDDIWLNYCGGHGFGFE